MEQLTSGASTPAAARRNSRAALIILLLLLVIVIVAVGVAAWWFLQQEQQRESRLQGIEQLLDQQQKEIGAERAERSEQQQKNLAAADPARTAEALGVLEKVMASLPSPGAPGPPAILDDETLKALRSLGYVP